MTKAVLGALALTLGAAVPAVAAARPIELTVQMGGYEGEPAFFAVYLVDADNRYVKTLWVSGKDRKYYSEMSRWWKYLSRQPQDIDAITGASSGNGKAQTLALEIDETMLNAGYSLRIESAVEDVGTYPEDATVPLGDDSRGKEIAGNGFIRFVTLNY